jgi:hypothetical protein
MPYAAAKAVAAKFAWPIRHLLVPVFGPDFLDMCVKLDCMTDPSAMDRPNFTIDNSKEIIDTCLVQQYHWRENPQLYGTTRLAEVINSGNRRATQPTMANPPPRASRRQSSTRPRQPKRERERDETPGISLLSIPTPPLDSQSPPNKRPRTSRLRVTTTPTRGKDGISPAANYPSPSSPDNPPQGATYSPQVSPRTVLPRPIQFTPINATTEDLNAAETLLSLRYDPDTARTMREEATSSLPKISITGLGVTIPSSLLTRTTTESALQPTPLLSRTHAATTLLSFARLSSTRTRAHSVPPSHAALPLSGVFHVTTPERRATTAAAGAAAVESDDSETTEVAVDTLTVHDMSAGYVRLKTRGNGCSRVVGGNG